MTTEPVLELQDVSISYRGGSGWIPAVRDVSLKVPSNSIVGLVGESGCGKSTLAYGIMRLLRGNARIVHGKVLVNGQDVYHLSPSELRRFRWQQMSMVFQSAMSALNPVMTVEQQMADVFWSHRPEMTREQIQREILRLLELVRIHSKHLRSYPHELSGGMRQRIVIAIAIALNPSLVIMDEPTTALDVVVQRSILDQIREIQKERHFSILFISHDFSLVAELAAQVAVMYAGRIVEVADASTLRTTEGHHPYTQGLMRAIPRLQDDELTIEGIPGHPPNMERLPSGCAYHPRCPLVRPECRETEPRMHQTSAGMAECHLFKGVPTAGRGDTR